MTTNLNVTVQININSAFVIVFMSKCGLRKQLQMNGLQKVDYDILLRHFLSYQTDLNLNVADPVKVGWNIFRLFCQVKVYTSILLALIWRNQCNVILW